MIYIVFDYDRVMLVSSDKQEVARLWKGDNNWSVRGYKTDVLYGEIREPEECCSLKIFHKRWGRE